MCFVHKFTLQTSLCIHQSSIRFDYSVNIPFIAEFSLFLSFPLPLSLFFPTLPLYLSNFIHFHFYSTKTTHTHYILLGFRQLLLFCYCFCYRFDTLFIPIQLHIMRYLSRGMFEHTILWVAHK